MKKFLRILPLMALFVFQFSAADAAVFAVNEAKNQTYLAEQFGADDLNAFVNMKAKDVAKATGKKLTFKEKLTLKIVQRNVKRQMKKGERVDVRETYSEAAPAVRIGGFLLGFFLLLIGVLIAWLIDSDLLTSALYGLLAAIIVAGLAALL